MIRCLVGPVLTISMADPEMGTSAMAGLAQTRAPAARCHPTFRNQAAEISRQKPVTSFQLMAVGLVL